MAVNFGANSVIQKLAYFVNSIDKRAFSCSVKGSAGTRALAVFPGPYRILSLIAIPGPSGKPEASMRGRVLNHV